MRIPLLCTGLDLVVRCPLRAPKVDGVRIEHATPSQRFQDFGWLPLRVKAAKQVDESTTTRREDRQVEIRHVELQQVIGPGAAPTQYRADKPPDEAPFTYADVLAELKQTVPTDTSPAHLRSAALRLLPAPRELDFDQCMFARRPPGIPTGDGSADAPLKPTPPGAWSDADSAGLARFVEWRLKNVGDRTQTRAQAQLDSVEKLREKLLGEARYETALQGKPLPADEALVAGSPDHLRYYELLGVIADAFKSPAEAAQEIERTEPDAEIREGLLQRLKQCERGLWNEGGPAPDAPDIESLEHVTWLNAGPNNHVEVTQTDKGLRLVLKTPRKPEHDWKLHRECRNQQEMLNATGGLWNPNLVRVFGVITDDDAPGARPSLMMEEITGVELLDLLEPLDIALHDDDDERRKRFGTIELRELVGAIEFIFCRLASVSLWLKKAGFGHNDFKPENVIIDEFGEPNVVDLEWVRKLGEEAPGMTGGYESPERSTAVLETDSFGITTHASDMYSIGATLREALSNHMYFSPWTGQPALKDRRPVSGLLRNLLAPDPEARPGALAGHMHPAAAGRTLTDAEARAVLRKVARRITAAPATVKGTAG